MDINCSEHVGGSIFPCIQWLDICDLLHSLLLFQAPVAYATGLRVPALRAPPEDRRGRSPLGEELRFDDHVVRFDFDEKQWMIRPICPCLYLKFTERSPANHQKISSKSPAIPQLPAPETSRTDTVAFKPEPMPSAPTRSR